MGLSQSLFLGALETTFFIAFCLISTCHMMPFFT